MLRTGTLDSPEISILRPFPAHSTNGWAEDQCRHGSLREARRAHCSTVVSVPGYVVIPGLLMIWDLVLDHMQEKGNEDPFFPNDSGPGQDGMHGSCLRTGRGRYVNLKEQIVNIK